MFTETTGGDLIESTTSVTIADDHSLYAQWTIIDYTITYYLDEGTNNISNPATYTIEDVEIVILDATKEGYTFDGWFNEDLITPAVTTIETGSTGDVEFYAVWTINQYTITFDSNEGSVVAPITQDYGTSVVAPDPDPTKELYKFEYWCSDIETTQEYVFETMPAENITLYAKWHLIET